MNFDLEEYLREYRVENAALLEAGQAIDPANAEVAWSTQPVTLEPAAPEAKKYQYVRIYAARKPPTGPWIDFHDMDGPIATELWGRLETGKMFRAGYYLISVDDSAARAELVALRLQEQAARDALEDERIEEGLLIDPATAEMTWYYAEVMDPYRDGFPDLPHANELGCVGRERCARAPGGMWVNFDDLPEATCEALCARRDSKQLVFPNGVDFPVGLFDPEVDVPEA